MDRILNSEELDALREAVESDAIGGDTHGDPRSVILDGAELPTHRFGLRRRSGGRREEALSALFTKVGRALATRLSDILETPISVSVTWMEQTRFEGFREVFELDGRELASARFPAPGGGGGGLISVEPSLITRVVEGMMGGNKMAEAPRGRRSFRPLSELDLRVSRRWVTGFLQDLALTWNPHDRRGLMVTALESSGAAGRSFPDSAEVIAALLEVSTPKATIGMLGIVVPEASAESLSAPEEEDEAIESVQIGPAPLRPAVPEFEVEVEVALARQRMSVRDFLGLSVGDVVFLEPRQVTTAYVQGVPKFVGVPGAHKGQKAIQISQLIGREEAHA